MRYDSYKLPDGRMTVRAVRNGSCNLDDMLEELTANTTATRSDGLAVINFLSEYLRRQLGRGSVVTIDGVGTFGVSLSVDADTDEERLEGRGVSLKRITFKASPKLRQDVAQAMKHERVDKSQRNADAPHNSIDERRSIVLGMSGDFTSADYRKQAGVSATCAHYDLQRYEREGLLQSRHVGRTKLYSICRRD